MTEQDQREAGLVAALREIAKQQRIAEIDKNDREHADYDYAYDEIVSVARAALAAYETAKPKETTP